MQPKIEKNVWFIDFGALNMAATPDYWSNIDSAIFCEFKTVFGLKIG